MADKMQFSDHVVRAIEAGLPYGQATLATVAVKLAIGQRSLQRRLREEGVSFVSLRDKTRLRLAQQYLKTSPQSKIQIAYRLGFCDPNSFFRRHRQWVRDGKLKSD
jgi:AraC-like DNA-binding protein